MSRREQVLDDAQPEGAPTVPVAFETPQHRLTLNLHPRELKAYTLTEHELDVLSTGNASTNLAIACTGLGMVATLAITLATVPLDSKVFGAVIGALSYFALCSLPTLSIVSSACCACAGVWSRA
jgi:hypothetical protein